jgi:hypothetical protein
LLAAMAMECQPAAARGSHEYAAQRPPDKPERGGVNAWTRGSPDAVLRNNPDVGTLSFRSKSNASNR